jgi:hypothetical protein
MAFVDEWTPAYKGVTENLKSTVEGFQYELGKEYVHDGEVVCCFSGFHCCAMLHQTFVYYPPHMSRYFKVEYRGHVHRKDDKISASEIRLVEEVNLFDFYTIGRSTYTDDATHLILEMKGNDSTSTTTRYINEQECKEWKTTVDYNEDGRGCWIFNRNGKLDSPGKTPDEPYGKPAHLGSRGSECNTYYYNNGAGTYIIISTNYGRDVCQNMLADLLSK